MKYVGSSGLSLLLILISLGVNVKARPAFTLEHSYNLPITHGALKNLQFADIDRNGVPEIAFSDSLNVCLYSLEGDSLVAKIPLDTMHLWRILLSDVNRDSISDLVIAYWTAGPDRYHNRRVLIKLYDGAANYAGMGVDSVIGNITGPVSLGIEAGTLACVDMDGDGYGEMMASVVFDQDYQDAGGDYGCKDASTTLVYRSFPITRLWQWTGLVTRLDTVCLTGSNHVTLATRYNYLYQRRGSAGQDDIWTYSSPRIVSSGGSYGQYLGINDVVYCNNDRTNSNSYAILTKGSILNDPDHPNILVRYHKELHSYPVCPTITIDSLILYSVITVDSIVRVSQRELTGSQAYTEYFSHSQYPGKLLSRLGSYYAIVDPITLLATDSTQAVPGTNGYWAYPGADGIPRFVVIGGSQLSMYLLDSPTSIDDNRPGVPECFSLSPNYPNPFNPSTVIEYSVPTRSHVTLVVFNILGQRINTLVDADRSAGKYQATWDGTDSRGKSVASGIYFYRLESGPTVLSRKMLLLK